MEVKECKLEEEKRVKEEKEKVFKRIVDKRE